MPTNPKETDQPDIPDVEEAPRENGKAPPSARNEKKKVAVDFTIDQFSTMTTPPVSPQRLAEAQESNTNLFIVCPFHKRDGRITKLTLSPKYLKALMSDNPVHLSTSGTSHFYVYSQQLNEANELKPVQLKVNGKPNKVGRLCVTSVIRLPRHIVKASEVGDEHLREGAERLIVRVNLTTGLAYPKSLPYHISNRKAEETVCRVIREIAAVDEIFVGQRFGQYSTIETIEDDAGNPGSVTVKFKIPASVATL